MRYIRLRCPKCENEKLIRLDRYNEDVAIAFGTDEIESSIFCYGCLEAFEVIEIIDKNEILSEPISKVEKRNSL